MPERSRKKKPRDVNELAARILAEATGDQAPQESEDEKPEKNAAAVELGRKGGLKGGKARAEKMTPERRSEIAKRAADTRWAARSDG